MAELHLSAAVATPVVVARPKALHEECGMDVINFSSREIPHRIEMNPVARRVEMLASPSSKSDDVDSVVFNPGQPNGHL